MTILVVDDEPEIGSVLRDVLQRRGHDVTVCQDGPAALEHARVSCPEIAFLDMKMPVMNGVELLRHLRTLCPSVRVIMITGYATDAMVQEALSVGVDACLAKPVRAATVLQIVGQVADKSA
jgi:CheY-like chemotaxis protein